MAETMTRRATAYIDRLRDMAEESPNQAFEILWTEVPRDLLDGGERLLAGVFIRFPGEPPFWIDSREWISLHITRPQTLERWAAETLEILPRAAKLIDALPALATMRVADAFIESLASNLPVGSIWLEDCVAGSATFKAILADVAGNAGGGVLTALIIALATATFAQKAQPSDQDIDARPFLEACGKMVAETGPFEMTMSTKEGTVFRCIAKRPNAEPTDGMHGNVHRTEPQGSVVIVPVGPYTR